MRINDRYVIVENGSAHVLAVDENEVRHPLATVGAGEVVVGSTGDGPVMLLVSQPGVQVRSLREISPQDLRNWRSALAGNLRFGPAYQALVECRLEELGAQSAWAIAAEIDHRRQEHETGIEQRLQADATVLDASMAAIRQAVVDPGRTPAVTGPNPVATVLEYIGHDAGVTVDLSGCTGEESAAQLAKSAHLYLREVRLVDGWTRNPSLPLLGWMPDGDGGRTPVALLPRMNRYLMRGAGDPKPRRIGPSVAAQVEIQAHEVYLPLPMDRPVSLRDLLRLSVGRGFSLWALVLVMSLAAAVLALATPVLTQWVMGTLVPDKQVGLLVAAGTALTLVAVTAAVFSFVEGLAISRISQLGELRVQAAIWGRLLMLPPRFFRGYTTGDLSMRATAAATVSQLLSASAVVQIFGALFSLVNFVLLWSYSPTLAWVALLVIAGLGVVLVVAARRISALTREEVAAEQQVNGWLIQLLAGIAKIRIAGLEDRMTALQLQRVHAVADVQARQTILAGRLAGTFSVSLTIATAMFIAVVGLTWDNASPISPTAFLAFTTAFGTVFGAVAGLTSLVQALAAVRPNLEIARPILDALPESVGGDHPGALHGAVEFRRVSFRYAPESPLVLRNLSFTIAPGEFVALVGPSGSGKSSVLRVLLGFEQPEEGQVLLDGRDLADLDLEGVRQNFGVVLQDGKLLNGTLADNIRGGIQASEQAVWQAAEQAALADEIRAMPMQLHTLISPGNVSGGQAQRILLARALLRRPAIAVLDEATSALDNLSQAQVTESLSVMGGTRIVVAHRLSTIKDADRILVVVDGQLHAQGSYDELIATDQVFAELARRQIVETRTSPDGQSGRRMEADESREGGEGDGEREGVR